LFDYQSEAVQFLVSTRGRAILGDAVGLGKTVELLGWISTQQDALPALIAAPANVIYKWQMEVRNWLAMDSQVVRGKDILEDVPIHIISYDLLRNRYKDFLNKGCRLIVGDECVPSKTLITMADGTRKFVEDVVVGDMVLGIDDHGSIVGSLVERTLIRKANEFIIINEDLILTPNHPVYVEGYGYVRAEEIACGSYLRVVQTEFPDKEKGQAYCKILFQKLCGSIFNGPPRCQSKNIQGQFENLVVHLRVVWQRILSASKQASKVLQQELFSKVENVEARLRSILGYENQGGAYIGGIAKGTPKKSESGTSIIYKDEDQKPHFLAGSCGENIKGTQGKATTIRERGQWQIDNTANENERNAWVACRSTHSHEDKKLDKSGAGPCMSGCQDSTGDGWTFAQYAKTEDYRSQERIHLSKSWLYCCKGSQPSSIRTNCKLVEVTSTRSERREDTTVYNFETTSGNYIASKYLVHNCHYLKGFKSKRYLCFAALAKSIPYIVGLSATPIPNRPIELWNILNLLYPKEYKNVYAFARQYCDWQGAGYPMIGASNTEELSERLKKVIIRRTKAEVAVELPRLTRALLPVDVDLSDYREVAKNVRDAILALSPDSKGYWANVLDRMNMLRKAIGMAKMPAAVDWVKDFLASSSAKLVIYAHHLDVVSALRYDLREHGVYVIEGSVLPRKRAVLCSEFREQSIGRVLIMTSAGKEGIDLFGLNDNDISNMLFVEREWRPSDESQAEGRLDRIGQTLPVTAWYLMARGTIDARMDRIISQKRQLIDQLVGEDDVIVREIMDSFLSEEVI